jgi:hypothetical protein
MLDAPSATAFGARTLIDWMVRSPDPESVNAGTSASPTIVETGLSSAYVHVLPQVNPPKR